MKSKGQRLVIVAQVMCLVLVPSWLIAFPAAFAVEVPSVPQGEDAKAETPGGDSEKAAAPKQPAFNPKRDLLLLHYDHAPDKDDGHSAAADRTLLMALQKVEWIKAHVVAVSGAYGINKPLFNKKSDAVMDAAWNDLGGWVAAHDDWDKAVEKLVERVSAALSAGGDVWVKEGGQSDITAAVVKRIKVKLPEVDTTARIHVVQHSTWNEQKTTPEALVYTKAQTRYVRIKDANAYLNQKGGDEAFTKAALVHPTCGAAWKAAFEYYKPETRLDFSDTGELLHILGLGEIGIDEFRTRYLEQAKKAEATEPATQEN